MCTKSGNGEASTKRGMHLIAHPAYILIKNSILINALAKCLTTC